jgi:hypothetical protein
MDVKKIFRVLVIMVSEICYSDYEQVESDGEEELSNDGSRSDSVVQPNYAVASNFYRKNRFSGF